MTGLKSGFEGRRGGARASLAGLACAILAALVLAAGAAEPLSRAVFDFYQRLQPRDLSGTKVHVVWIDERSVAGTAPWPWPRYLLAELTREIAAHKPAAIGFDMLFASPDPLRPDNFLRMHQGIAAATAAELRGLRSMDAVLAGEIGRAPVVLARLGTEFAGPGQRADLPIKAQFSAPLPAGVARYAGAIANIADLEKAAFGHGLLNAPPDPDALLRRVPLVASVGGRATPGFALELARLATGINRITPVSENGVLQAIELGERTIPVTPDGRVRIHFGRFPATSVTSAHDLLQRSERRGLLAGKIVVVGLAAAGTEDVVATPLEAELYGVLVQAQAVDAILRDGWLARPAQAPAIETATGALLTLLVLLVGTVRRHWIAALPWATAGAIVAISWFAFAHASLLLDPVRPLLIGGAAAAGLFVVRFRDTRREREGLQAALLEERVGVAEAAGELQAARDIQRGMLPPRATLAALDTRLDVDALLEPARSVAGDFFDAVRLGDDCIAFVIGDVTGKGLSASLFMALSKALTKSVLLREGGDLTAAAAMLDAELSRDNAGEMAVTMLIAMLNLATGEVRLCNAGHENPLLVAADGSVRPIALEGGPPFCVKPGYLYPSESLTLAPGDTLVLLTDGATEAQNAAYTLFGNAGVAAALVGRPTARAMTESLVAAVRAFEAGTDPSDDLTVMAIRYSGVMA